MDIEDDYIKAVVCVDTLRHALTQRMQYRYHYEKVFLRPLSQKITEKDTGNLNQTKSNKFHDNHHSSVTTVPIGGMCRV